MSTTEITEAESTEARRVERTSSQLCKVADFLRQHQDILVALSERVMSAMLPDEDELPHIGWYASASSVHFTVYGDEQRQTMRALRSAIGGKWRKGGYGDRFSLSQTVDGVYVTIDGDRQEICQRVVVGTETKVTPEVAYQPEKVEQVEKVEWVCGNLLAD